MQKRTVDVDGTVVDVEFEDHVQQMFSIYDAAAEYFAPPFVARTVGEALRHFESLANDKTTQIGVHPKDFTLFWVGAWNMTKGHLVPSVALKNLGLALELVQNQTLELRPNGQSKRDAAQLQSGAESGDPAE